MPEQIPNRHQAYAFAHQVRGERVAEPVRAQRLGEARATTCCAHAFVDRAARECLAGTRTEERCGGELCAPHLDVLPKPHSHLIVEWHGAFIAAPVAPRDGEATQVHLPFLQSRALARSDARAVEE